jgi:tRNA(Ile)-lysidine synthase
MLRQLFNIDKSTRFILACSGGPDSMAIADFYHKGHKSFMLAYFNHGTSHADEMGAIVKQFAEDKKITYVSSGLSRDRNNKESIEEFWRNERYYWLASFKLPIVTAHHLDDVLETWIFSSLHGNPKIIYPKQNNLWHPFLLNEKFRLLEWCMKNNIKYFNDQSNLDVSRPRNRIRHNIVSEALLVNPGLRKVLKKKILLSND